jgi:hypothetical protein
MSRWFGALALTGRHGEAGSLIEHELRDDEEEIEFQLT